MYLSENRKADSTTNTLLSPGIRVNVFAELSPDPLQSARISAQQVEVDYHWFLAIRTGSPSDGTVLSCQEELALRCLHLSSQVA